MLFHRALCSSFLLASSVLAVPSSQYQTRAAHRHESREVNDRPQLSAASAFIQGASYSTNWAGAVWNNPNVPFTSVTGTFAIPALSGKSGGASVWVGIDGYTCTNAAFQTGVQMVLSDDGSVSYSAWYEWYPAPLQYFGIDLSAGDTIKLTVTTSSTTDGIVTVENLTNSQTASGELTSTVALCRQNAEWIVQDFDQNGQLIPFVNFSTVMFTDAEVTDETGATYSPSGDTTLVNIQQNDRVLTSVWTSGSSVAVLYEYYAP